MPPTLKDSSKLSSSPENPERSSGVASGVEHISSAQPVTLEVPVTVNGARAVEGSDKREPFSETTSTVLVLANGAVIRLSSSVAPGQLLFLTNEKTKKEVVCQVVKSKNYRSASGYVELEFTEPVLGFWGMRFPGERYSTQTNASLPAARKVDPAVSPAGIPAVSAEPTPVLPVDAKPPVENVTTNIADEVQEFKTEIKADSRPSSKADFLAPAETSTGGLTLDANRLEDQLSALLSDEQKQSDSTPVVSAAPVSAAPPSKQELGGAAAKIFDMVSEEPDAARTEAEPAKSQLGSPASGAPKNTPAPAKSSFDDEEVKIPAWLEPLARNAAIPAPLSEKDASDSTTQLEESQTPEPVPAPKQTTPTSKAKRAAITPKRPPAAPLFGNSLLGGSTPELASPRRSGKGPWKAIAAGLLIAAASGAWYFRDSLASLKLAQATSGSNTSAALTGGSPSLATAPTTNSSAPVTSSLPPIATPDTPSSVKKENSASALTEAPAPAPAPASSQTQGKVQTAAITERVPKSGSNNDVTKGSAKSAEVLEAVEPEIKKPSLGQIRLAKPKVRRSTSAPANGEMEPELEVSSDGALATGENSLGANLAESSKQPAAPAAPVGGDVKPAHLISSVPPSYPSLARTQHIAGDVRVDALIDATGRVTTMKVVSGPSLLHQAAMDALRQWKYQAATLDGKPVAMHLTVTLQFRLQ
jgi:TonB family protein